MGYGEFIYGPAVVNILTTPFLLTIWAYPLMLGGFARGMGYGIIFTHKGKNVQGENNHEETIDNDRRGGDYVFRMGYGYA